MKQTIRMGMFALAISAAAVVVSCGPASEPEAGSAAATAIPEYPSYSPVAWPTIPNNWVFGLVSGIAHDSQDHIWLITRPRTVPEADRDRASPSVLEFDAAGNYIQGWGGEDYRDSQEFEWPNTEHGINVDDSGNVWLAGS
ncbi:MAG: hypothetical protein EXR92_04170, partial [Gemmatimonadetes bacterium]|nr:hypothetical protein [Gemmatimonadota bacterium]